MKDNEELILTPELKHYGKLVDKNTGKFIKWVSNPNKTSYLEECADTLDKCLKNRPNDNFVKSCSNYFMNHRALSPKQLEILKQKLKVII